MWQSRESGDFKEWGEAIRCHVWNKTRPGCLEKELQEIEKYAKPVVAEDEDLVNGDESEEEIKYSDKEIDINLREVEELAEEAKQDGDDW